MNVCKFKVLEIFLNILRLISFKFGSGRGPPLGVLVFGMEVVLMVLFEEIILYMPGKF